MIDYELIKKISIENLKRLDLGAAFRFNDATPYLERLIKSFSFFQNKESNLMETDRLIIIACFDNFHNLVNQIKNFGNQSNETSESILNRRNVLIKSVKELDANFTTHVLPIYLRIKAEEDEKNFQTKIENFNKIIVESEKLVNTKISTFESNFTSSQNNFKNTTDQSKVLFDGVIKAARIELQETQKIKDDIKNFSVKKIVERYGSIFSGQATKNFNHACVGLSVFFITLIIVIILTFRFFFPLLDRIESLSNNNVTASTTIQLSSTTSNGDFANGLESPVTLEYLIVYIISRLTILGLMTIVLKESLKNYNVNMHLYNLNLHRQHSLESFDMLVANTTDEATRDLIIKELAQTIYANQEDGYLPSLGKKVISVSQVTELIKALR
jgi:hypothetical protein